MAKRLAVPVNIQLRIPSSGVASAVGIVVVQRYTNQCNFLFIFLYLITFRLIGNNRRWVNINSKLYLYHLPKSTRVAMFSRTFHVLLGIEN